MAQEGVAKQHPNSSEIAKKFEPNGSQKPPKWSSKPSKTEFIRGQEGARTAQKLKKHKDATKKWMGPTELPHFIRKSVQHGSNFASKIEPKPIKNRCKNRLKN